VPVGDPDNRVGIVIYNNCDVLMTLPVTGFIDANVHQTVEAFSPFLWIS
jgi:hypothetical protein